MHRLALLSACLVARAAFADLTMVSTSVSGGVTREITVSVRGPKAFFELRQEGAEPRTLLRDGEAKKLYMVNHGKKELVVVTEQDSQELQANQAMIKAQMEAQLARLPPEQRARLEAAMAPMAAAPKPSSWTYEKKKGPSRKLAGFSCQDYVVKRDGKLDGEGCFASWKDAGLTAVEFKDTLAKAMPRMAGDVASAAFEGQETAPGFPVHRTFLDAEGQLKTETTLKSLTKSALGAERFELPKDYVLKDMADAMKRRPAPAAK